MVGDGDLPMPRHSMDRQKLIVLASREMSGDFFGGIRMESRIGPMENIGGVK